MQEQNSQAAGKSETGQKPITTRDRGNAKTGDIGPAFYRWLRWLRVHITRPDVLMVVLTAFIAATTILNVWVFYKESESTSTQVDKLAKKAGEIVYAMNKALDANRDAIDREFTLNKQALDQAKKQSESVLDASKTALRTDLRPWLGTKEITLTHSLALNTAVEISVNLFNTGKTPALDVTLSKLEIGDREQHMLRRVAGRQRAVVAPNNNEMFYAGASVTNESIQQLINKTARIYARGKVTYRDVFGKAYTTTFCAYYPGELLNSLNFLNCDAGNSMN